MATAEWTVLEKLLLSQAVYKYGEDNWFQIARNLKHHALLDRPSDYFNQKNCSLQYYLMVEDLAKEKRNVFNQDMPVVVQIARQLYSTRLEELKKAINVDEEKFLALVNEIDEIRAGKWDQKLLEQYQQQQPITPIGSSPAASATSKALESEAQADTNEFNETADAFSSMDTAATTTATEASPSLAFVDKQKESDRATTSDATTVASVEIDTSVQSPITNTPTTVEPMNTKQADFEQKPSTPLDQTGLNIVAEEKGAKIEVEKAENETTDVPGEETAPLLPFPTSVVTATDNEQQEPTVATVIPSAGKEELASTTTAISVGSPQRNLDRLDNAEVEESSQPSVSQMTDSGTSFDMLNSSSDTTKVIELTDTAQNDATDVENEDKVQIAEDVPALPLETASDQIQLVVNEQHHPEQEYIPADVTATPTLPEHDQQSTIPIATSEEHSVAEGMEWSDSSRVHKRQAGDSNIVDEPEPKRLKKDGTEITIRREMSPSSPKHQQQQYHTLPSSIETDSSLKVDTTSNIYSTDDSSQPYISSTASHTDIPSREGSESVSATESNAPTPITNVSATPSAAATPTASAALTPNTPMATSTTERKLRVSLKDDPRHKSWQKNINLLWREIANHKNGAMFMNPIKESIAPRYYEIVKRPMDLKTIKNRIRDGLISNTTEFERDVVLMLNNSLMYNKEGTEVYLLAREMLDDALEQIRVFKTADTDSSASSHTRAASMAAKAERRKSAIPE